MNSPMPAPPSASPPSFSLALRFWLWLGCVSFGGPAGQIAIMHRELVERRGWISEARFLHALNYCMLLPGPEAQQLATYCGWLLHGTRGGIVAGLLFILPSLLLLILLSWLYMVFGHTPLVTALFLGIKPAVAVIVLHAAWRLAGRALRGPLLWAVAAMSFVGMHFLHWPFPFILMAAALLGGLAGGRVAAARHEGASPAGCAEAVQDNEAAPAPTAAWRIALLGALCWLLPMGLLLWLAGGEHTLTRMAWFFSKAALVTFGGAYAVLPYVCQAAVSDFGWLSATQMMDGLALGETTPGPLIMVLAFVGFVGAYGEALFGPDQRFLAGALAAVLVSWNTFLPSFLFILLGAPLVERSRHLPRLAAPLAGVTAAVVGVMLSLAAWFVSHALWPLPNGATESAVLGVSGTPSGGAPIEMSASPAAALLAGLDPLALLLALVSAWLLFRRGIGVLPLIGLAALAGLCRGLLGA